MMPKGKSGTAKSHGRNVSGYRGIGSGKDSYKTSTSKPGSKGPGYKMTGGDGKGKTGKKY